MARVCLTSDSTTVGITRFGPVEYNTATNTVLAWQGVNPICGYAYDAAINAGDLIRVLVKSPQLSAQNTAQGLKNDLDRWLRYVGMCEEEFDAVCDGFRDPRVWRIEQGQWVKDTLWGEPQFHGPVVNGSPEISAVQREVVTT